MIEPQNKRIERLGNPDNIWFGESGFYEIYRWPCNEYVTLPAGYAVKNRCAGCGKPLKSGPNEGALQHAIGAVVKQLTSKLFEVFHPDCAESLPFAHEMGIEANEAAADQLSLFG